MSDIDLKALRDDAVELNKQAIEFASGKRQVQDLDLMAIMAAAALLLPVLDMAESAERRAEEAEKERDALKEVADMYEWLRDVHMGDDPESINLDRANQGGLDAAIKAAMAQEGGK